MGTCCYALEKAACLGSALHVSVFIDGFRTSSFYWYLLVNFKSHIISAGFSSSSGSADKQAQSISSENALLLPFILWRGPVLTRWQEDIFSSSCRPYYASVALSGFHVDSSNHTGAQRTDPTEHITVFVSIFGQQLMWLPKKIAVCCVQVFLLRSTSAISAGNNGHLVLFQNCGGSLPKPSLFHEITTRFLRYLCCCQQVISISSQNLLASSQTGA